jgi:nitrite reductase/ring-hydroxylating ferredoxin subunit
MTDWVRVAALSDIPPGRVLSVRVEGEDVALYNVYGALHATRDCCLHQSYPLSKGSLRGKYVRCPLHGWEFDVVTGASVGNPESRLRRYPVKVEGEDVYVSPVPLPPPPPPPPVLSRDDA